MITLIRKLFCRLSDQSGCRCDTVPRDSVGRAPAGLVSTVVFLFCFCSGLLGAQQPTAHLEDPVSGSTESGIAVIRGWVCNATLIQVQIDDGPMMRVGYGTSRPDTISVCGDEDNGWGMTWNWNRSGPGPHRVRAYADGVLFGDVTFTVTTLGSEFLRGAGATCRVFDFPSAGQDAALVWQENKQNFVIAGTENPASRTTAASLSTPTACAEEDNVDIPLSGGARTYTIEATHPAYPVGSDDCAANFTNCPTPSGPSYAFSPGTFKLYDDGNTVMTAVRQQDWWRPRGMQASVDDEAPVSDVHYVAVSRKVADANEWPQFLVLYMDGNLRRIPHPPLGKTSVCFGSSVIVGPAVVDGRPIAEIQSVRYVSGPQALEITYRAGRTALCGWRRSTAPRRA